MSQFIPVYALFGLFVISPLLLGQTSKEVEQKAEKEESIRPGINDRFKANEMDIDAYPFVAIMREVEAIHARRPIPGSCKRDQGICRLSPLWIVKQ